MSGENSLVRSMKLIGKSIALALAGFVAGATACFLGILFVTTMTGVEWSSEGRAVITIFVTVMGLVAGLASMVVLSVVEEWE